MLRSERAQHAETQYPGAHGGSCQINRREITFSIT